MNKSISIPRVGCSRIAHLSSVPVGFQILFVFLVDVRLQMRSVISTHALRLFEFLCFHEGICRLLDHVDLDKELCGLDDNFFKKAQWLKNIKDWNARNYLENTRSVVWNQNHGPGLGDFITISYKNKCYLTKLSAKIFYTRTKKLKTKQNCSVHCRIKNAFHFYVLPTV